VTSLRTMRLRRLVQVRQAALRDAELALLESLQRDETAETARIYREAVRIDNALARRAA
jgi:hypothetical protein